MRIIDRYINKSIITIFLGSVFIFCFLYILIDVTSQLDEFIDRKIPIQILLKYYISFFPIILVQTSSIACLISVLLSFSNFNNNNEITAMRSSGLNFWQIARPALCFGLIISAVVFWLNERYVPQASQSTRQIRDENMVLLVDQYAKKTAEIKNLTFYGLKNRLYYIDTFLPNATEVRDITIIEYSESETIQQKIVALKGTWTGIAWKFFQCQVTMYEIGDIRRPTRVRYYPEKLMDIQETPQDFMKQRLNVNAMNYKQLEGYINRFSNSGAIKALNNLRVDLYQKLAYPVGNFVIVLIGLPFAMMVKSRRGLTFTSLGIAIAIGFLYYVVNALSLAFGKGGLFPPIVAAWAPPLFFSGVALTVIRQNF